MLSVYLITGGLLLDIVGALLIFFFFLDYRLWCEEVAQLTFR